MKTILMTSAAALSLTAAAAFADDMSFDATSLNDNGDVSGSALILTGVQLGDDASIAAQSVGAGASNSIDNSLVLNLDLVAGADMSFSADATNIDSDVSMEAAVATVYQAAFDNASITVAAVGANASNTITDSVVGNGIR